jgi:hypothetical protein
MQLLEKRILKLAGDPKFQEIAYHDRMARLQDDPEVLRAALAGYQHELSMIEQKMEEIRRELGGRASVAPRTSTGPGKKRVLSSAARRRIAAAQKKRWAAYKKAEAAPAKKTPAKGRKMSAAGRKRIAEATKKRWAAFRAAKAAAAAA